MSDERLQAPGEKFVAPAPDPSVPAPRRGGLGYRAIKRAFDVVFSGVVCLVGLVPSLLLCAAIRLDSPGPAIFRQERVGLGGKKIGIFKFRSMVADAHEHPERYMTPEQLDTWRREQKLDNDPRITRVGRFLRNSSLDEIPQFLNVLLGDLSVIGPRPVTESETYEFGESRDEFLSVKPGITGWWQVTERNDATWANGDRQLLELFYVRHASLALDARIFFRTFRAMGRGM
ncbi:sugar transferase [Thermophilibacter sp.]